MLLKESPYNYSASPQAAFKVLAMTSFNTSDETFIWSTSSARLKDLSFMP